MGIESKVGWLQLTNVQRGLYSARFLQGSTFLQTNLLVQYALSLSVSMLMYGFVIAMNLVIYQCSRLADCDTYLCK